MMSCREAVTDCDEFFIGNVRWSGNQNRVGVWHADKLCETAVQAFAVNGAHAVDVNVDTLGVKTVSAEPAFAVSYPARRNCSVSFMELFDRRPDFLDDADKFMAYDGAWNSGDVAFVEIHIGSTDARRRRPDQSIAINP